MDISTLTSGTLTVPYMPMTTRAMICSPPVLTDDFHNCRIPGGLDFWENGGFYSPGNCFTGYRALCTQTTAEWWPIRQAETVVRGFTCNAEDSDQRYVTSEYDGTTLSAPAFEIRWKDSDRTWYGGDKHTPRTTEMVSTDRLATGSSPTATSAEAQGGDMDGSVREAGAEAGAHLQISKGAIAGVILGALFGLGGLLVVMVYCFAQRGKRGSGDGLSVLDDDFWEHSTLGGASSQRPAELDPRPASPKELPAGVSAMAPKGGRAGSLPYTREHISLNSVAVELEGSPVKPETNQPKPSGEHEKALHT